MNPRRVVVHIDEVIVDAAPGADLARIEAEVRSGIAASFAAGTPPAFARSAPALEATHGGVDGLGAAIASASPPRRRS